MSTTWDRPTTGISTATIPYVDEDHVVVVSHRPRPTGWHPEASYHFATSVEEGIARAHELAGEGEIGVGAGEVGVNRPRRRKHLERPREATATPVAVGGCL